MKKLEEKLLQAAEELGFDNYKIIDTMAISFEERFRMYCEMNYCGNYDKIIPVRLPAERQRNWRERQNSLNGRLFCRPLLR